jgi:hypothetical protein
VALLVRIEILVLAAAFSIVWGVTQLWHYRWHAWKPLAIGGGLFMLGFAAVHGPYRAAMREVPPRAEITRPSDRHPEAALPASAAAATAWVLPDGASMAFDVKEPTVSSRRRGYATAVVRFGRKLADAFGYWIGALALFGAWRLRRRPTTPADRFVQLFFVLYALIAVHFAATEGYLVSRHLLILVVAGLAAVGFGALELGRYVSSRIVSGSQAPAWATVVLAGAVCLPMTLIHFHDSRQGHRVAAGWLAADSNTPGKVLDSRGWTALYSGRQTYHYDQARTAFADPHLAYVVLEKQELGFDSRRSRTLRVLLEAAAEPVAEFPRPTLRKPNQQPVLVYRWHPERLARRDHGVSKRAIAQRAVPAMKTH